MTNASSRVRPTGQPCLLYGFDLLATARRYPCIFFWLWIFVISFTKKNWRTEQGRRTQRVGKGFRSLLQAMNYLGLLPIQNLISKSLGRQMTCRQNGSSTNHTEDTTKSNGCYHGLIWGSIWRKFNGWEADCKPLLGSSCMLSSPENQTTWVD